MDGGGRTGVSYLSCGLILLAASPPALSCPVSYMGRFPAITKPHAPLGFGEWKTGPQGGSKTRKTQTDEARRMGTGKGGFLQNAHRVTWKYHGGQTKGPETQRAAVYP